MSSRDVENGILSISNCQPLLGITILEKTLPEMTALFRALDLTTFGSEFSKSLKAIEMIDKTLNKMENEIKILKKFN